MKKHLLFLLLAGWGLLGMAQAQDRTVSGRVTASDDGSPLPGVTVAVKGTTRGTTTDANGTYRIAVEGNQTLRFSAVGFAAQEIATGSRTSLDVALTSEAGNLSEVVVVGYGTVERRNLTGSQSSVAAENIATLATPSFATQLGGRAAGVQVSVPNGLVGQAPRIRIRGTNSISSGAGPLVVIDNVPVATQAYAGIGPADPLSDINPNDIESIEILKDGASTAIFGSRAANGVILITTKRGKANRGQRVSVNYNAYVGVNSPINRLDLLNAAEFVTIANEKYTNAGQPAQAVASPNGTDTDWQDVILRNGAVQNHALSISGASETTNYFFSAGYLKNNGPIVANDQTRYSFRGNFDHSLNKWLAVGASLSYTRGTFNNLNTGGNALSGNVTGAARLLPNVSPYLDPTDPNFARFDGYNVTPDGAALGQGPNLRPVDNNFTNLAFVLAKNKYVTNNNRIIANANAEATIIDGLRIRTQIAADLLTQDDFQGLDPRHGDGRGSNGFVFQRYRPTTLWNWQNTISYNKKIADVHNVNFVAGLEYQKSVSRFTDSQGQGFSDLFFIQQNLISGSFTTQLSGGGLVQNAFDSYFARLNYNYAGKYFISATVRNDGLSSLPQANRRGTFPGGSVAWRISEEGFMKNVAAISDLRLRASYAIVGNTNIGFFPYLGTFGASQYGTQTGIAFDNTGNPDLKWEQSKKTNIGFDLGLLDNRITVAADYFINDVDGLVQFAPTPASLGVPGNGIFRNIGALQNKGFELSLDASVIRKEKFSWDVNFNFTSINNKITALNNGQDIITTYHITRVGQPIGSFYGFKWAGVNPANGNPMWYKGDGQGNVSNNIVQYNTATGTYFAYNPASPGELVTASSLSSTTDRFILGNSNPTFQGGLTNRFRLGGFDLEVFTRYSGGNYVMNLTRQETLLNLGFQNNGREILDRWTTPGQITDVPRLWIGREAAINNTSATVSRFLEKGDFVRIQNIVLGYTVPASVTNKITRTGIRSIRVYGQIQNAFTFTGYKGLDPELSTTTGNADFGLDQNASPIIRTTSVGINVGF
jgi:TonB-linked SusC/RagA family outer membrane protein